MFVFFCTAASLFLVFLYNYTYTKSWTPVIHSFQRTNSKPYNLGEYSTVHEDEEQRRQQRTREALQTSKDEHEFKIGMKNDEISSKKTSSKKWNGESAERGERNKNVQRTFAPRKNLIILSPGRGGSSFLGTLFDRNPHVMYLFEPLYTVAKKIFKVRLFLGEEEPKNYRETCLEVIDNVLQCNFSDTSKACNSYSHTVIKILSSRVPSKSIQTLKELFQQQNRYDVKLVQLVRDPRAVVFSRVNLKWMKHNLDPSFRENVQRICDPILQNVRLGLLCPPPWLKDRFKVIRYEDRALNTLNVAQELYSFAGFDW